MAVRLWRRGLSPPSETTFLPSLLGRGGGPRWAFSSSSSSSSSPSPDDGGASSESQKKTTDRVSAVIDALNDRKLPQNSAVNVNPSGAQLSETDVMNIVERRIWHAMEEGQFENLPGKGKPLDLGVNPHSDPLEDTLYSIFSKNGCAPQWIELNKEIRRNISEWRSALKKAWTGRGVGSNSQWTECSEALKGQMRDINDKVFRYNLIAPFGRQMCGLKWENEIDRLKEGS